MMGEFCGFALSGFDSLQYGNHTKCEWERRIVANTSAFQAEDAGSIPVVPSSEIKFPEL